MLKTPILLLMASTLMVTSTTSFADETTEVDEKSLQQLMPLTQENKFALIRSFDGLRALSLEAGRLDSLLKKVSLDQMNEDLSGTCLNLGAALERARTIVDLYYTGVLRLRSLNRSPYNELIQEGEQAIGKISGRTSNLLCGKDYDGYRESNLPSARADLKAIQEAVLSVMNAIGELQTIISLEINTGVEIHPL